MSVIVKSMEMPENCSDCPLNYDQMACKVTGTRWWSDTMVLMDFDSDKERLHDCPLIEVALGTDTDVGAMEVTCENCMHCTGAAGNEHCFNCAHYYEDNFIPRRIEHADTVEQSIGEMTVVEAEGREE